MNFFVFFIFDWVCCGVKWERGKGLVFWEDEEGVRRVVKDGVVGSEDFVLC